MQRIRSQTDDVPRFMRHALTNPANNKKGSQRETFQWRISGWNQTTSTQVSRTLKNRSLKFKVESSGKFSNLKIED